VIGVALSLTWLVYVSTRPPMPLLGREAGTDVFRDLDVNFIDSQGSAKLTEIHQLTQVDGVELRLAGVKPQVRAVLDADGVFERIGADHIHGNVHTALDAQWATTGARR
jgi:SulP family sulfate permease